MQNLGREQSRLFVFGAKGRLQTQVHVGCGLPRNIGNVNWMSIILDMGSQEAAIQGRRDARPAIPASRDYCHGLGSRI